MKPSASLHDPAQEAEVLRRRAERLARPPAADPLASGGLQALEFSLGEQRCLLEAACLREVTALRDLLPMPMAPPSLLGIAQWRGRMLPVLDLAVLLSVPAAATPPRRLLVLGRQAPVLALATGEIHGLQPFAPQEVEHRSQPLEALRPEIVRGVTRDGRLLLDGDRLMGLQRDTGP